MATITPERMRELLEIYNEMKRVILQIDDKYSLVYKEPEIDLPESLNLQKMTYTPKTEAELKSLAEQYVASTILAKQRTLDSAHSTKMRALSRKRSQIAVDMADKSKEIDDDYAVALEKLERKIINNGLLFSSSASNARAATTAEYSEKKSQSNASFKADLELISAEEFDVEAVYKESCVKLAEEKAALVGKRYQVLVAAEAKEKTAVDKYNNSIEEKEQRYQYTREKFIETMRNSERKRVLDMTKLYIQLGNLGYRDREAREKYFAAQDAFWPLRRNEAQALLSYDSFLITHLDTYYNTFVDWVNTMLLLPND